MSPLEERFWCKVRKTDNCWYWEAGSSSRGYGRFKIDGKLVSPHRLSYELKFGKIPQGMWVLYHCDNPACVRPDHLFLGTHSDNMKDARNKGRLHVQNHPEDFRGEKKAGAILTKEIVRTARAEHAKGTSSIELSEKYGVSVRTMRKAIRGTTWKYID